MMSPVKLTVVGCGAAARSLYRRPLASLEKKGLVRVAALVDVHASNAETLRETFPNAKISADLREAILSTGSELTLVLSPPGLHSDHALAAFRHGSHVLCEKPMALTEASCREMIDAAQQTKRVLAVGMIRRYFPAFAALKDLLDRGELGTIQSFTYREGHVFDWDITTPATFTKTVGRGGGVLLDIGTHVLDCLLWLFGVPRVVSYADDALRGVEANVRMELGWPGFTGTMQLSWNSPLRNEFRVSGTRAEAVLKVGEFDNVAIRRNGTTGYVRVEPTQTYPADLESPPHTSRSPRLYTQAIYCQVIQVLRSVRLGEPPAVTGEVGLNCLRVIDEARRVMQPLEMPWLDPIQQMANRELYQKYA